jgi:hypothetical protein
MLTIERPSPGSAEEFHHREVPALDDVALWWFEPERPALVLGSTQSIDIDEVAAEWSMSRITTRCGPMSSCHRLIRDGTMTSVELRSGWGASGRRLSPTEA